MRVQATSGAVFVLSSLSALPSLQVCLMAYDDSTNRVSFSSADLAISEAFCAPPFYPTSDLQSALLISPLCHPHTVNLNKNIEFRNYITQCIFRFQSQLPPLSFNPPSSSMDMPNVNNTVNDPCAQVVQVLLCYHQVMYCCDYFMLIFREEKILILFEKRSKVW